MNKQETRTHALLSASSSNRWLKCTPSAIIESQYPEQSSPFASEGTQAHELCETYIKYKLNQISEDEFEKQNIKPPHDMQFFADQYSRYVLTIPNRKILQIEKKPDLQKYIPEGFGTCDAFVYTTTNRLHIIDFKYGKGVKVSATYNAQLMIYALGVLESFPETQNAELITLHIYQPRIENISTFTFTKDNLLKWAKERLVPAATKAYKGEGEFKNGEHCRFCRHKHKCETYDYNAVFGKEN